MWNLYSQKKQDNSMPLQERLPLQVPSRKMFVKSLVGKTMAGSIEKVESEPYQYSVEETGEVITLTHRFVYVPEGQTIDGQIEEVKAESSFY